MQILDFIISFLPLCAIIIVGDRMADRITRLPFGAGLLLAFGGLIAGMGSAVWLGNMALASRIVAHYWAK